MNDSEFEKMVEDFTAIYPEDQLAQHYKNSTGSRLEFFKWVELRKIRIALDRIAEKKR